MAQAEACPPWMGPATMAMRISWLRLRSARSAPHDPVAVKLAGIVEAALCHISIHTERAEFLQEIHTRVTRSSKVARPNRPAQSHPSHTPLPDGSLSSLLALLLLLPQPSTQGHLLP